MGRKGKWQITPVDEGEQGLEDKTARVRKKKTKGKKGRRQQEPQFPAHLLGWLYLIFNFQSISVVISKLL